MRLSRPYAHVLLLTLLAAPALRAVPSIGATAASPSSTPVGVPATVTVTSVISDPAVVASSVNLQRLDSAGRVVAVVGTLRDDGLQGDAVAGDRTFTLRFTVLEQAPGPLTFRTSASFQGSLVRVFSAPIPFSVTGTTSTGVAITSPANLAFVATSPVIVSGTVGDPGAQVRVNGIAAVVTSGRFQASVPLAEGTNTMTAVATNTGDTTNTASVTLTLDTTPPRVAIDSPETGFTTTDATLTVTGLINDLVVGTVNDQQATVTVNGVSAQVANRTFSAPSIPLALGANTIQAVGRDRSGNSGTASVQVTRLAANQPAVRVISGNNQTGPVGSQLAQPLTAAVLNAQGQPLAGRSVIFSVRENNGTLQPGQAGAQSVAVTTDAQGRAQARLTLGTRAGVGNNVVEVTSAGVAGSAVFTASGQPTAATKVNVDSGMNQTGTVGQPLAFPFVAVVTDAGHNRIADVPVTFTVRLGGGNFAGAVTRTTTTDGDGRALAVLTVGSEEGNDVNVIEASFAGNPGQPAAFTASARLPGPANQTRISGVVLDNSNNPIPNVTMRLFQTNQGGNNALPMQVGTPVVTNAQGQFAIQPAPVGFYKLMADGTTALPNGTYPTLEYDIVTVSGRDNTVGLPIYLPRLDRVTQLCVTATTGGTLTLPSSPGFSLTVAPGSATFPGGSRTGCISVTPVNGDKVPMVPGFGQQPRFVVTIQPVGTQFNPPARIAIPNVDGLQPRAKTEMYSFDHDLASFVSIGSGTVSDDGSVLASDPGVGVVKAGWHCGGNPNQVGSAGTCPTCQKCQGSSCVPDNTQRPPEECKECRGGSATNVANGVNPNSSTSCCFAGQTVANQGLSYEELTTKCPPANRKQNPTRNHEIDGCTNSPDDPVALNYGFLSLAQRSTAFGAVEAPLPSGSAPRQGLPCNWHDICYQTCGSIQDNCDRDLQTRAHQVCDAAYPEPNPYALLDPRHLAYISQRGFCRVSADGYYNVLSVAGGGAYRERQSQYCNCCR